MTGHSAAHLLANKVVVISGIGPGLGQSLATEAAAMGADVVLVGRTASRLDELQTQLAESAPESRTLTVPTDITDPSAREALLERTLAEFGRVDALVNNAFAMPPMEPLTEVDLDGIRIAQETNVFAPIKLAGLFADALEATGGSVVMVNSTVTRVSDPIFGPYKLTKGALLHATSALATELGARGIRVNSIAPSYIYGEMNKMWFAHLASERGITEQEIYDEKAAPTDLKKLATGPEIARAALFYVSDLSSVVTGTTLDINCGEFHSY